MPPTSSVLFKGIGQLVTLRAAAAKQARNIRAEDLDLVDRAAFVVQDGALSWVGEESKLPAAFSKSNLVEVDLGGAVVMPGFVESHTQLVFAGTAPASLNVAFAGSLISRSEKAGAASCLPFARHAPQVKKILRALRRLD